MHGRTPEHGRNGPITSLVFPTYNPGSFLDRTWQEVSQFLDEQPAGAWEVVFVCDGCTDDTPARLEEFARSRPEQVRVLSYRPNRGKGYAVRQGLMTARGQWRLFTDVDLAYGFDDVLRVAETLRDGADLAIASRSHPESRLLVVPGLEGYVFRRYLQSQVFSTLVRLLLPLSQRDTQAGLKGLTARAAEMLVPRLHCNGFGFDCELLTAGVRHGLSIVEIPVRVRYEGAPSTTSFRTMGRMVRELWNIRKHWPPVVAVPTPPLASRRKAA